MERGDSGFFRRPLVAEIDQWWTAALSGASTGAGFLAGYVAFRIVYKLVFALLGTKIVGIAFVVKLLGRSALIHIHIAHVITDHME